MAILLLCVVVLSCMTNNQGFSMRGGLDVETGINGPFGTTSVSSVVPDVQILPVPYFVPFNYQRNIDDVVREQRKLIIVSSDGGGISGGSGFGGLGLSDLIAFIIPLAVLGLILNSLGMDMDMDGNGEANVVGAAAAAGMMMGGMMMVAMMPTMMVEIPDVGGGGGTPTMMGMM